MSALFAEFMPYLAGLGVSVLIILGAHFRGKSSGKDEAHQEVANKTNQQAAEAAKESRDVQSTIDRLPTGAAADELRRKWLRKPPAGRS